MTRIEIDPPGDDPTPIPTTLQESSDRQRRAAFHCVHQHRWARPPLTDSLVARPGEEIVRIDDRGASTSVVGPTGATDRDGTGVQYQWHYPGHVDVGEGE